MKRVKVTPLVGSATHGAVCSLLEIDEYRILLDCGYNGLQNVNSLDFFSKIGHVDLVLLSHGDIHHMGALPLIFGQHPVPVLCTLPVFKFGRLMLYDLFLNTEMEGNEKLTSKMFTLDEVDNSLQYVATVKYNQSIQFPFGDVSDLQPIHFCAYPSGRTIGGATWLIRYGAIEVLYAMDINLKKDNVIDAIRLNLLPASPSLLILEGGAESRVMGEEALARNKGRAKDRQLVDIIMETLRQDGNVLIPCETGGRTLELLYLLDKHWEDHKVGLYNLVLFSPMATHAIDYARSQLEWMKDSLSKSFYNEKPNPFELPKVKIITNMKEFKLLPAGPKVVLCTDANFSCGVSKSLLLQWAENPLNRVMFSDYPDQGSLASTLLSQSFSPPVISQVTYPERVLISGDELQRHLDKQNKLEKDREEELQRERLQEELMEVAFTSLFTWEA